MIIRKINNFFRLINISAQPKNVLIFTPFLLSNLVLEKEIILSFILAFFTFFLITSVIYITNDFFDKKHDFLNKIKKNPQITINVPFSLIVFLNIILLIFIFIIYQTNFFSFHLIYYIISFYFYNFYFKKIKYIDIIFLANFYLQRVFYGADIFNIELSPVFLLFFTSLFFILALAKRYVQIQTNQLSSSNKLLAYSLYDIKKISYIKNFFLSINILSLIIFLLKDTLLLNFILILNSKHSNILVSINEYIAALVYMYLIIDLILHLSRNKIRKDFYTYVISNPKYIIIITFFFLYIFLLKII